MTKKILQEGKTMAIILQPFATKCNRLQPKICLNESKMSHKKAVNKKKRLIFFV